MIDVIHTILTFFIILALLGVASVAFVGLVLAAIVFRIKRRLASLRLPTSIPVSRLMALFKRADKKHIKGRFGEVMTRLSGAAQLPSSLRAFHDITLPDGQGGTTQVDHVYVGPTGMFVVETKNLSGFIYGKANEPQWTQVLNRRTRHTFQNPIRQNYKHICVLADICQLPRNALQGVVVFSHGAKFPNGLPTGVFTSLSFARHIASFKKTVLTSAQVEQIVETLGRHRLSSGWGTHQAHVNYLNARHAPRRPDPPIQS